jgi:hypothetical protein
MAKAGDKNAKKSPHLKAQKTHIIVALKAQKTYIKGIQTEKKLHYSPYF